MPKCKSKTKFLPATFAWVLLLGERGTVPLLPLVERMSAIEKMYRYCYLTYGYSITHSPIQHRYATSLVLGFPSDASPPPSVVDPAFYLNADPDSGS
jgi:hypothetical protein